MEQPAPRATWTDADFDELSWHDCHIHGLAFRTGDPGEGDWTAELVVDLDLIVGGSCGLDGSISILAAPCTLVFHHVSSLTVHVEWRTLLQPASIVRILRQPAGDRPSWRWTIELDWPDGTITFEADGFTQRLRGEPVEVGSRQHLTTAQRQRVQADTPS